MKTKNVFSVGLVLVAGMVAASALFFPVVADARNIKVGIIDTYSGPPAVFGNDALNGFKMALDEINKQGVLGGKIEFVTRDDKFKVDIALNMAKELVLKENVDVLVGTVNSGVVPGRVRRRRQEGEDPLHHLDGQEREHHRQERPPLRLLHDRKHGHGRQGRRQRARPRNPTRNTGSPATTTNTATPSTRASGAT